MRVYTYDIINIMSFKTKGLQMFQSLNNLKSLPTFKPNKLIPISKPPKNKVWFCDDDNSEKLGYMHTVNAIHLLSEEKKTTYRN